MPLWDWSSDHLWRPNRREEEATFRLWRAAKELGVDYEGIWEVEIRDREHRTQWVTKRVKVERFPSGALEIVDGDILRHYSEVRRWIRKIDEGDKP